MLKRNLTIQLLLITVVVIATALAATAQIKSVRTLLPKTESIANPAADLDQCANGQLGTPVICAGSAWVNGNLNQNQAHYLEGESVPYRLRFSNLVIGPSYTVTIEWDTTVQSGAKHAIDYVTSFDQTETDADPCSGVSGCDVSVYSHWAIPPDPNVAAGNNGSPGDGDDIVQIPGDFVLFGGSIQGVSGYTLTGTYAGASQTRITITFTAGVSNPVLAWGGHISTRYDWGFDHSAIAISGASYHTRLIDLNGTGGNQDRSLANSAAIFPGTITIIKDARPNVTLPFAFTATGYGMSNFMLDDDGFPLVNYSNTVTFSNLLYFGSLNPYTFVETASPTIFTLSDVLCSSDAHGGTGTNNNTIDLAALSLEVQLEEGESVTCTFVNAITIPTASEVSVVGRVHDPDGTGIANALLYIVPQAGGEAMIARSNGFGYYRFDNVPAGRTYVLTLSAKGYILENPSIVINLNDSVTDLNFVATRAR